MCLILCSQSLKLLALVAIVTTTTRIVSASSSTSPSLPPFVQHVDKEALQDALAVAKQRHLKAVQKALSNYPTNCQPAPPDQELLDRITLREYPIHAPGQLPDFGDILPKAVYVTDPIPLFTPQECAAVIAMAEEHFQKTTSGTWSLQTSGAHRMSGFWIRDIPAVHEWFVRHCQTRLFPLLARQFPEFCDGNAQDLCVDNSYMFKYTPETGRRTAVHTDSGCLSFTIALNGNDNEYTGGGTWYEGLEGVDDNVLKMKTGQVCKYTQYYGALISILGVVTNVLDRANIVVC